jgi:hypothetical protein
MTPEQDAQQDAWLILANAATELDRDMAKVWTSAKEVALVMVTRARWHLSGLDEPYVMITSGGGMK